jgi:glycosyltransferase involved in cell wall biosynthesis
MSVDPVVSVIIPTHNRAHLLGEAIDSVLSQNVDDIEIIVVDDDSTDGTQDVIARYPKIRNLRIKSGKPSRTRNAGINAATGKYVAFLDDDDIWLPNRLQPAIDMHENRPDVYMVYGQAALASYDLKECSPGFPAIPLAEGHPIAQLLKIVLHMNAVTMPRRVFDEVGLFDESVYGAEDMDLTVRTSRLGPVAAIPQVMALVRTRNATETKHVAGATQKWLNRMNDDIGLLKKHFAIADAYQPDRRDANAILLQRKGWYVHMLLDTAQQALEQGDRKELDFALRSAFRVSPLHVLSRPRFYKMLFNH